MKKFMLIWVALFFTLSGPLFLQAAEYPAKDIRLICPWDAGGGADSISRTIGYYAMKHIPKSIFVENLTGGITGPAVFEVMQSIPDGYTIGALTYDSVITVPRKKMIPGYDLDRLAYIANLTREGYSLVVQKDAPWKNLAELVADAKTKSRKLRVGTGGLGGASHLPIIEFERLSGVKFKYIPYKGAAAQNEALLMGEIDLISTSLGDAYPVIEAGKARPLAVMESVRNQKEPNCPTFIEEGYDLVRGSFLLIATAADTPKERIKYLENLFYKAFHDPEFLEWTKKVGVEAAWMNSEETGKFIQDMQKSVYQLMDELVAEGLIKK